MKNCITLFLADDDQDDCLLFTEALAELSLPVILTVFNDGEALLKAMSPDSDLVPDLVFLDMNMPKKNGLECLGMIRAEKTFSGTSVVILSTFVDEKMARSVMEMGANGLFRKPSNYADLKKTLQKTLADLPTR